MSDIDTGLCVAGIQHLFTSSGRGSPRISFVAPPGNIVALIGPSGCGKSTTLACIAGVLAPTRGVVVLNGKPISDQVSLAMQVAPLFEHLTAWENIALARGYPSRKYRTWATTELERVGLSGLADSVPSELSVGQRQRVAVVASLVQNRAVLLFDEPTGNLDDESAASVLDVLRSCADSGRIVVLATHDQRVVSRVDRVVTIEMRGSDDV